MICKFCGNEIDDNSDFCFICGQKVEPQQAAPVAAEESVYSEPQEAVATAVAEPVAPVYQAPAASEAPVAPEVPVAEPEETSKKKKKKAKKEKKAKKAKTPSAASGAVKFFSFLFAIIGLILYNKAKKAGNEQKAVAILNAVMTGVCVKLAIVNILLLKKFIL